MNKNYKKKMGFWGGLGYGGKKGKNIEMEVIGGRWWVVVVVMEVIGGGGVWILGSLGGGI
jgi:hypothetical protein